MKLHEPIAGFKPIAYPEGDVTQFFGENPALYASYGWPGHNGWDITRAYGTPILAVEGGKVVEAKEDAGGNGRHVRIFTQHGEWIYGHLSRIDVSIGQQVAAGQQIGLMGNSGFVVSGATPYWEYNPYAGTHLHLTFYPGKLRTTEPTWNKAYPSGDKAIMYYPDNGYNGAVDFSFIEPTPAPTPEKASDRLSVLAAQARAAGNLKQSVIYDAVAALVRSFGF